MRRLFAIFRGDDKWLMKSLAKRFLILPQRGVGKENPDDRRPNSQQFSDFDHKMINKDMKYRGSFILPWVKTYRLDRDRRPPHCSHSGISSIGDESGFRFCLYFDRRHEELHFGQIVLLNSRCAVYPAVSYSKQHENNKLDKMLPIIGVGLVVFSIIETLFFGLLF